MKKAIILTVCTFLCIKGFSAIVDTIVISSQKMQKEYKAVIVLPDSYKTNDKAYPVLYLLHGGYGHFSDWIKQTAESKMIQKLSDQYNFIVVMPEGETFSYYLDSKEDKDSQFETYITKDVIAKIDNTYRTVKNRKGRVITGLSMGGFGALYLSIRHPDLFGAAGSMSGALNPDLKGWKMTPEREEGLRTQFAKILGPIDQYPERYAEVSVINMIDKIKAADIKLIFDDGVDDFLIEVNRELHRRLVFNGTPHEYSERSGTHTWEYWKNSLPYHALFFAKFFSENGVTFN